VEEKPEVRNAGGVFYTPEYIVRYIVENTVGKLIEGKTPAQIAEMRFADIACGSGSFLLGVYDLLLRYHTKFYNENPGKAKKGDVMPREGGLHLSLQKKREILVNNIYGVDIDNQAVEVAQLSLYLKLLQDETPGSARQYFLDFEQQALLPTLNKNIACGNSLIGRDVIADDLFESGEALQFPAYRDAKPIEQAKRNAQWLANFLTKKTGEPVQVAPLVVLPGWFVKISEKGNFPVWAMNGTFLPGHLQRQAERVDSAQVRRIISAIDDKCRDVEF
jgi:hypothetical protein